MIQLIDSHCHLNYDYTPKSVADLVGEAAACGVNTLITVGTDIESLAQVQQISDQFLHVYHTVGVHPHEAITLTDEGIELLRKSAKHPKCKAIGEIGLDYHYDHSPRDIQKAMLEKQLALALELNLPVVIHSREGETDLLEALTRFASQVKTGTVPGIIHCFTGTREFGEACLSLGFYISFSGIVTFKTAEDLRVCARVFPLDRILVETDSPYLAPIPNRGKKCEPSMVLLTAQKIAEVRGISLEDLSAATLSNTRKAFNLPIS